MSVVNARGLAIASRSDLPESDVNRTFFSFLESLVGPASRKAWPECVTAFPDISKVCNWLRDFLTITPSIMDKLASLKIEDASIEEGSPVFKCLKQLSITSDLKSAAAEHLSQELVDNVVSHISKAVGCEKAKALQLRINELVMSKFSEFHKRAQEASDDESNAAVFKDFDVFSNELNSWALGGRLAEQNRIMSLCGKAASMVQSISAAWDKCTSLEEKCLNTAWATRIAPLRTLRASMSKENEADVVGLFDSDSERGRQALADD
eukprot:5878717-Pyramimonas_sp.AAC.1